jgi:hypothetical protein
VSDFGRCDANYQKDNDTIRFDGIRNVLIPFSVMSGFSDSHAPEIEN